MVYNAVNMSDGTEYRVLVEFKELVKVINSSLKRGELLTLPMGTDEPGAPVTINPQHIVSLTDFSHGL
jgi:hypothetical protein